MKNTPLSNITVILSILTLAIPALGQDWADSYIEEGLKAETLRSEFVANYHFEVVYPPHVQMESIGDGDVWVVNKNGYNELASLVSVERLELHEPWPDEGWPEGEVPPDVEQWSQIKAKYSIPAPGQAWVEEDNGSYTAILDENQVAVSDDEYLPAKLLGHIHIAVGTPEPVAPTAEARIKEIFAANEVVSFQVVYRDENGMDLSSVRRGHLSVLPMYEEDNPPFPDFWWGGPHVAYSSHSSNEDNTEVVVDYVVHSAWGEFPLWPGGYEVHIGAGVVKDVDGLSVAAGKLGSFTVESSGEPAAPREAHVDVSLEGRGADARYIANAEVVLSPMAWVTSWGQPRLTGNTYVAEVQIESVFGGGLWEDGQFPADIWFEEFQHHRYDLGRPGPGEYGFQMVYQGEVIAETRFAAEEIPDIVEPKVSLEPIVSDSSAKARVKVDFGDAAQVISEWGDVRLRGNTFFLNASSHSGRPPNPTVWEHVYQLLPLPDPGPVKEVDFEVVDFELPRVGHPFNWAIRSKEDWQELFTLDPDDNGEVPQPPVPFDDFVLAYVGLGRVDPGIGVAVVRVDFQEGIYNVYYQASYPGIVPEEGESHPAVLVAIPRFQGFEEIDFIELDPIAFPSPPPPGEEGFVADGNGGGVEGEDGDLRPGPDEPEWPEDPELYYVNFSINGQLMARTQFRFRHGGGGGPVEPGLRGELRAESIFRAKDEPHKFVINWHDGEDPDMEKISSVNVRVSNADVNFFEMAELVDIAVKESFPPQICATYVVAAPGGAWDEEDNGFYEVSYSYIPGGVDPATFLPRPISLGGFSVRIFEGDPEPDPDHTHVELSPRQTDDGHWAVDVAIEFGEQGAHVVDWREPVLRGDAFVVSPEIVRAADLLPVVGEHTYRLGPLEDGVYIFALETDLASEVVEFVVGDPNGQENGNEVDGQPEVWSEAFERWLKLMIGNDAAAEFAPGNFDLTDSDGDGLADILEFAFGSHPLRPDDAALPTPHIMRDEEGGGHMALSFNRLVGETDLDYVVEVSRDMKSWIEAEGLVDMIDRKLIDAGTEQVTVCMKGAVGDSTFNFMRVSVRGR